MPIRYLKPGVRDSEAIDALTPLAETMFYRLLVTVDDFGRYDARPAMIKSHCFPIKEAVTAEDCRALLAELADAGLILVYEVDGKPYLQMLKWDNLPRAKESKFPAPANICTQMYADAPHAQTNVPLTETETETETQTENRKKTRDKPASIPAPDGVEESLWADFLAIRKAKRAPLTATAMQAIEREASKAGWTLAQALSECCARGWQGFKAEWVAGRPQSAPNAVEKFDPTRYVNDKEYARRVDAQKQAGGGNGTVIDVQAVRLA